jgi:hypothetical protein
VGVYERRERERERERESEKEREQVRERRRERERENRNYVALLALVGLTNEQTGQETNYQTTSAVYVSTCRKDRPALQSWGKSKSSAILGAGVSTFTRTMAAGDRCRDKKRVRAMQFRQRPAAQAGFVISREMSIPGQVKPRVSVGGNGSFPGP